MIKKFTGLALIGILACGQSSAEAFKAPDILIDSKLDYDWSGVLIAKLRLLLKNYKMTDPFIGRFPENKLMNEAVVGEFLSQNSKDFISGFGNAIGLSLLDTNTKVYMKGFSYDVKGFKTDLKASEAQVDGLVIGTDFSASQVDLAAERISLTVVIPNSGASNAPVFTVDIINPVIRANEDKLINFFAKIKIQDHKDYFKLQIQKANFDQMAQGLLARPQDIKLDYERIVIPESSLKIGNKTINFIPSKIEKFLRDNHEAIKSILLAQVASSLKDNTTKAAFKVLEQYQINKEHWIGNSKITSQFEIGNFSSSLLGDHIEINMPGDFCTRSKFDQLKKNCVNSKVTQIAQTRLNKKLHNASLGVMKDLMGQGDANIVASISEDYFNKLLVTTYDAGLWKKALDEAGVELGPNKVILKLDKRGDSGTLMMDVVYKPTKMERVFTGSKNVRFPLVMDVSIRVEKHDNDPVVIIRLNDVDTTNQTLIFGRSDDHIISTVQDIPRFKNKVANSIRKRLEVLKNKDIVELRYPEFSGLGFEKIDFLSDGNGRMNAIMRLEDLLEDMGPQT
jgi:hypothetical protein